MPRLVFALAAAVAASSSSVVACGAVQESTPPPREAVAETARFRFFADPDMNLHHLLYHWARAENGEALTNVAERDRVGELSPEEREVWDRAVATYWRFAGTRSVLFDDELNALRDRIAARAGPDGLEERDRRLYEALELARPVYAAHWADEQRRVNETWIADVLEDLPAIEVEIGEGIAAAYGGAWPETPVTVDVSPYTNRVGGYTTSDFHVTISSTDSANVMPQALEILFHEASHGASLEDPVHRMLTEAFGEAGAEPPDQLWHTVLFVTAGELTQMAYERLGRPGYTHYGDVTGLYTRRPRLTAESTALREHWVAFLRGRIDRETALAGVVRALTPWRATALPKRAGPPAAPGSAGATSVAAPGRKSRSRSVGRSVDPPVRDVGRPLGASATRAFRRRAWTREWRTPRPSPPAPRRSNRV